MKTGRLWLYKLATALMPETRFFDFKAAMLRWCGAKVGTNVRISSSAKFFGDGELVIGNDVWIGSGCMIYVAPRIKLPRKSACCGSGGGDKKFLSRVAC